MREETLSVTDARELPKPVQEVLRRHQARVHEAVAILELASNVLTAGGGNLEDAHEGGRIMSAIDGAIRILRPLGSIGDAVALREILNPLART